MAGAIFDLHEPHPDVALETIRRWILQATGQLDEHTAGLQAAAEQLGAQGQTVTALDGTVTQIDGTVATLDGKVADLDDAVQYLILDSLGGI